MTALAVDAQTRKLAWTGLQFQVIQGQPPDLTHAQAAIQHQAEHGTVARIGDGGEQSYQVNVGNVTRQMLAEAGGVQARPNRVGRRVVGFQGQEMIKDAQAGEAAVERGAGMAEALKVGEVAGHILGRDGGRLHDDRDCTRFELPGKYYGDQLGRLKTTSSWDHNSM